MSELSEKFVKKQDWFCYYGVMTLDKSIGILDRCNEEESIRNAEIFEKMSQEEGEVLKQFSIKNLMHILTGNRVSEENKERIIQIISEKIEHEPFYAEDLMKDGVFLVPLFYGEFEFSKLTKELGDKIKTAVVERGKVLKGTSCEKIATHFTHAIDYASFLACFEKGEFSDEKVAIIEKALEHNPQALRHVNFSIFQDNIYSVLGSEFVSYAMKFPNMSTQLTLLSKENPSLLKLIGDKIKETPNLDDGRNLIDDLVQYCTNNCYKINPSEIQNPAELIDAALRNNKSKRDNGLVMVPFSAQYKQDLEKALDEEYKKVIEDGVTSTGTYYYGEHFSLPGNPSKLDVIKNIYFNKYFSMSLEEAKKLITMYGQNVDNMQLASGKSLLQNIQKVLDFEAESQMDFSSGLNLNAEELEKIKQQMGKEYALSYTSELQQTQENIESEQDKTTIEYNGKTITQLKAPENFSLLVHSTGAGFVNTNNVAKTKSYREKWTDNDKQFNHVISMSYINQDFMGMAPVEGSGVIYGFNSINDDAIRLMGDTDINTYSNEFGYSASQRKYLTANTMPYHSRRVYNEFGVERADTTPDYVLLFDDSTEENVQSAYKAASDWDIPVLFMNKLKIKDSQIENLEVLRQEFEKTGDTEKLKALLNAYETNMAGWLLNRKKDEEDKSYTGDVENERFRESFDEEYKKISETLDNYLDRIANQNVQAQDKDLIRIMQIVLEERDLYAKCAEKKPISKTEITIDTESILQKLNQTMKSLQLEDFSIDLENIPTALEYKRTVTMKKLMKNALLNQGITSEEVKAAEQVLSRENEKEEEKEEHD